MCTNSKKMIDKLRLTDLKKNLFKFKRFNMVRCENKPKSRNFYILNNENFCHKFSGLCIRKIPGTQSKGCVRPQIFKVSVSDIK